MKTSIVTGLGFGDEGKGLMTDYLCSQQLQSWVVRFNGGHQAGHTVVTGLGDRHVFSSIGSGTLRGAPTYWSSYCTFYPPGFVNEYKTLQQRGVEPVFYIDVRSPVTTFYDVIYNRSLEQSRHPHGSCGLGFGATIERHESGCRLHAGDLYSAAGVEMKLKDIAHYYSKKLADSGNAVLVEIYNTYDMDQIEDLYLQSVQESNTCMKLADEASLFNELKTKGVSLVFEGAQGILLDMDHGFFPHVTRSNTTSKNALEIIRRNALPCPSIYYITRSYQTRHGAGPLRNESLALPLQHTDHETNVHNPWQGNFRKAVLDIDLLAYAIRCDSRFGPRSARHLVITCLDQTGPVFPVTFQDSLHLITPGELAKMILPEAGFLFTSSSDCADNMQVADRCAEYSLVQQKQEPVS